MLRIIVAKQRAARTTANTAGSLDRSAFSRPPAGTSARTATAARNEFSVWKHRGVFGLLLFLLVLAVFLPALRNDFINYDDNGYVTANVWCKTG